ncbi:AAA ATPase [Vulcanisaeta moutnovskia 768-28]|uniref:AAA ATPase n=2 Tax=Vulcanisaeta TaxID=164450 RepID=F0QXG5_VULM7|nr:AAA ATPase [Vulcanisaeta moutnovskia 768-28]
MTLDETHALVFGSIGTGKTTLVKNALMSIPCDYTVIVFDVAGSYEGFTDYHAPYPLNPLDYLSDLDALDVIEEVLTMRFPRLPYAMTPAMEYMFMRAYNELVGQDGEASISGIIRHLEEAVKSGALAREDEVNSARGLVRRLSYFNHWLFGKTHPIINRLINGELRGKSVGIDLSWFSPIQRWFYVLSFLAVLNSMQVRNVILVVDEAHLYFRLGESTLTTSVRVGRNFGRYFVLITQSPFDIPREFISMNKLFIEFPIMYYSAENVVFRERGFRAYFGRNEFYDQGKSPTSIMPPHWGSPLTAVMHLHITSRQMLETMPEKTPHLELRVEVNPEMSPRQNTTTLRRCAEAFNVPLRVVSDYGFECPKYRQLLEGVWECIGRP